MDLISGTSLVAAFIAGVAALFAPCCITVLLPSYLGSIFRERRRVLVMTFIFFLGVLLVFLPLGLGSAAFGQLLTKYHNTIFLVGGIFLLVLGLTLVFGIHFSLPWRVNPALKSHHPASVFVLGIFAGIATTCCAPVLAGVLALAALPGSLFWGVMYTLSYVLGMVAPLFFLSAVLDKTQATKKLMALKRPLQYSLGPVKVNLTLSEAISGLVFIAMGILTISLAFTNQLTMRSGFQVSVNIYLTKLLNALQGVVTLLPEYGWALLFIGLLVALLIKIIFILKKESYEQKQ
ncbi:MAG: hypothetical protein HYV42_01325 [Candidatus Magasanikbacteria bacterium]|nr:hypothetical protein [Candidatus Magasanikbacteria bacterium]